MADPPLTPDHPRPRRGRPPWALVVGAIGLALLASSFAAGYTVGARPEPTPAPTPTPLEPSVAVAKALLPSTVFIRAGDAAGSGFVYAVSAKEARILTAAHVVDDLEAVTVRLSDGTALEGKVLGTDPARDVAVVRVARSKLRPAKLARGVALQPGQMAVAIGSPFGLKESVTVGVISGTGRSLKTEGGAVDAIQTDAGINIGNSGGPLADAQARVIGINVAIAREGADRVGLAVPIDVAFEAVEALEAGEQAPKMAFLGVLGDDPPDAQEGALVIDVRAGSPAEAARIRKGDILVAIDGEPISNMAEFASAIRTHEPGDEVEITLRRDGEERTVEVTLGEFG